MFKEEKLKTLFCTILKIPNNAVNTSTSMETVESWDSLRHMSLIIAIEREFNVDLEDEEIEQMTSYDVIVSILKEQSSD